MPLMFGRRYGLPPGHRPRPHPGVLAEANGRQGRKVLNIITRSLILRLLRAGVGVLLLVLAAVLNSPLYPAQKQTRPSDICPSPWQLETWIAVSAGVLLLFALAATWKTHRQKRTSEQFGAGYTLPTDLEAMQRPAPPRLPTPPVIPQPPGALLPTPHSTTSLHSPLTAQTPRSSTQTLALVTSNRPLLAERTPSAGPSSWTDATPPTSVISPPASIAAPERAVSAGTSRTHSMASIATAAPAVASTTAAVPPLPKATATAGRHARLYANIDRLADMVDSFYILRFALFILGHVLLFMPSPKTHTTCYHASPMLWWGVFVGLLYDWIRVVVWIVIALLACVLLVKNLASALYNSFAIRMGWREPPPVPEPPAPAPTPLTTAELLRCKIVCYVPDPEDPVSEDGHSVMEGDAVLPTEIDPSRLPYPSAMLPAHRATCGVCQENFKPPREVSRIMYKVSELRQLPCEHVFHQACVDEWLSNHSDSCPYCNQSVRDGLKRIEDIRSAAASRVSLPLHPSAAASRSSLPMAMASRNASLASLSLSHHSPPLPYSTVTLGSSGSRNSFVYSGSASQTSLPMYNQQALVSQASLAREASGSRSVLGLGLGSASGSRTSLTLALGSAGSRTSLPASPIPRSPSFDALGIAHENMPSNIPRSNSRSSIHMNAASGSRISLAYVNSAPASRNSLPLPPVGASALASPPPSTSQPLAAALSPVTSPSIGAGSRNSVQYYPARSTSAAASRTSLVPVPEHAAPPAEVIPPVPSVPAASASAAPAGPSSSSSAPGSTSGSASQSGPVGGAF